MKRTASCRIVLVTAPDMKVARKVAKAALTARLAACANLLPGLESHYWWQGKLEQSAEILILFKTTAARLAALEKCVLKNHPYDTPEFVVMKIDGGNERYLEWLAKSSR